jgi:hypothetical protein
VRPQDSVCSLYWYKNTNSDAAGAVFFTAGTLVTLGVTSGLSLFALLVQEYKF